MLSYPGLDKDHVYLMHWSYRKLGISPVCVHSQVILVFTADESKKTDVSLCKLDINVKNRTAVAGSVSFFKLE